MTLLVLLSNLLSIKNYYAPHEACVMQQSIKQEAINAISSLPDSASLEDIMYRLYVLDKIKRGIEAADKGDSITLEELKREVETW